MPPTAHYAVSDLMRMRGEAGIAGCARGGGGGTTEVAMISLMLGERTAEEIKMAIGSAFPLSDEPHAEIRGRDLVSGLPKTIIVSSEEARKAIEEFEALEKDLISSSR